MKKEVKLNSSTFCYKTEDASVYHVGNSKIRIFSSLEGFITEETCFKLSKVETKRILLPKPFYKDGKYVGIITRWRERDWIHSFYDSGTALKRSLTELREELMHLSELGFDIGEMPFYCSYYDKDYLSFDGILKISESNLSKKELDQKNNTIYQDYLRGLVYSGMSEFETDGSSVANYLYSPSESPEKRLEKALHGRRPAGYLIQEDIAKHRNK